MKRSRHGGFFLIDALAGMGIVSVLVIALAVIVDRHDRATRVLAHSRQATAAAESALIDLQANRQPATLPDETLAITPLTGGVAVAGKRWVEVRATVVGKTSILSGLVPATQEVR